ncbi:MAG TPA: hypothetical protein PLZ93_08420 [Nocardioides sp.]|uniref:Ig-like domain repeat protein n=1 Tax=uncultured Nocardioides sp. TaxID=198441 RepID=UPI0026277531|nr:Ig-like domain repeat protein [uncultured Nocardioides sp.]HRI95624.1 hypothetical protein [Nocardioides sp.]HRK46047.1 hypothetical protein [Nocardioides sp.]
MTVQSTLIAIVAAGLGLSTLSLATAGPASAVPANDNLANAFQLTSLDSMVNVSTDGATVEPGETRPFTPGNPYQTVWYKFVSSAPQMVVFSTMSLGDNPDTVLTLYKGPASGATIASLTPIDGDDDGPGKFSSVGEVVDGNTTYYLQVDLHDNTSPPGSFGLEMMLQPIGPEGLAANDDLASAARLVPRINPKVDTRSATTVPNEPQQPECVDPGPIHNSVWYRYRATTDGSVTFETTGAIDSALNIWSGPAHATADQLIPVGCARNGAGDSEYQLIGVPGTTYYAQVSSTTTTGSPRFIFSAEQGGWDQQSKVTGTGAVSGDALNLDATVTPDPSAGITPQPVSGAVEFLENGIPLGSVPLTGSTARLSIQRPATGTHTYLVLFLSDDRSTADAFRTFTVRVPPPPSAPKQASALAIKAPKELTLRAPDRPHGPFHITPKRVKITASVSAAGRTPTGTVTFRYRTKTVTAPLTNGSATATITIRRPRLARIAISYDGDAYTQVTSGSATIKVKLAGHR